MKKRIDKLNWILGLCSFGLGLCSFGLALYSAPDLGEIFKRIGSLPNLSIVLLSFGLLLAAILILRLYNKRYAIIAGLNLSDFYDELQFQVSNTARVAIWSPDGSDAGKAFIANCSAQNIELSIFGNSDQLNLLISALGDSIRNGLNITRFTDDFTLIFICDRGKRTVVVGCINKRIDNTVIFKLKGSEISDSIHRLLPPNAAHLSKIADLPVFFDTVKQVNHRYLDNFTHLKSGFISFYGTDVLNIQSGWLERDQFRHIRTLDLTSNPALLLTRERYLAANRDFVRRPEHSIQRVFIIERDKLKDSTFRESLRTLAAKEIEMGIQIDIQFLENLQEEHRLDFILYDNYSVLVEDRQANSDYSHGRSTAYFSKEQIEAFEGKFDAVWKGGKTIEQVNDFLTQYA